MHFHMCSVSVLCMLMCLGSLHCQHIDSTPEMLSKLLHSVDQSNQLDEVFLDLKKFQIFDHLKKIKTPIQNDLQGYLNIGAGSNVTDKCVQDFTHILDSLIKKEPWALQFVDSFGKLPSGVIQGDLSWLGSFTECRGITAKTSNVSVVDEDPVRGQYCLLSVLPDLPLPPGTFIKYGMCLPDSCGSNGTFEFLQFGVPPKYQGAMTMITQNNRSCHGVNIIMIINPILSFFVSKVLREVTTSWKIISVDCKPNSAPELNAGAIVVIVILGVLGTLITAATLYDFFVHQPRFSEPPAEQINTGQHSGSPGRDPSTPTMLTVSEYTPLIGGATAAPVEATKHAQSVGIRLLLCFSVITNGAKILSTKATGKKNLAAIHGIRFISLSWVILGHTIAFGLGMSKNSSVLFSDYINRFSFQAIINASVSVDTFFLLSGVLAGYLLLNALKEKDGPRNVNWALVYFHRFWRLTPPYMLVIAVYTTLYHRVGSGPTFPETDDKLCAENWWLNLLYVNNFFRQNTQCIAWTWYLANDMQFFLIAPILVVALYKRVVVGAVLIFSLTLMNMIVVGVLTIENNYPADLAMLRMMNMSDPNFTDMMNGWFDNVYTRPYCRVGPYGVGVALGYILYRTELRPKLNRWLVLIGWVVAFVTCYEVVYGFLDVANGSVILSPAVNAFYASVHRIVWAMGVGWVIFACTTGYGGPVNTFLSWSAMVSLSRLTYMAYLIHLIVISYVGASQQQPTVLSDITIAYTFVGNMVMSYGAAFVVSLAFEAPMMALEKVIFPKGG